MIIEKPSADQIPALRRLWQQAFGDTDAFLDGFFATGFSPDRCRCIIEEDIPIAALYWFDCAWQGKKLAYIYAVATEKDLRGQGLCRVLMENTHLCLKLKGYAGAVLVPGTPGLADMYRKFGYKSFCPAENTTVAAAGSAISVSKVSAQEYAQKRLAYLPENAVNHGPESFDFLSTFCDFYAGDHFLFCAAREENTIYIQEFLGDTEKIPGILTALQAEKAQVRLPGGNQPFAMYHAFIDSADIPAYFGIALD